MKCYNSFQRAVVALLIAVAAVLMPSSMMAYDFVADGIYYNVNEDGLTVSVTTDFDLNGEEKIPSDRGTYTGDVVIPSTVNHDGKDYTVTAIGDYAFYGNREMTSIELPSTVTAIGKLALSFCYGLTTIALSESIKSIGDYGFYGCVGLTEVTIPGSVTYLGYGAFMHCYSMTSVTIEAPLETSTWLSLFFVFYASNALRSVTCYASTPPYMGLGMNSETHEKIYNFDNEVYEQAVLYVPRESMEKYRKANQWGDFVHIQPIGGYNYDLNGDGVVNVGDINTIINAILNAENELKYDVNGDYTVNLADLNVIISAILDD